MDKTVSEHFLFCFFIWTFPAVTHTFKARLHSITQCSNILSVQILSAIFHNRVCSSTSFRSLDYKILVAPRSQTKGKHANLITMRFGLINDLVRIVNTSIRQDKYPLLLRRTVSHAFLRIFKRLQDFSPTKIILE